MSDLDAWSALVAVYHDVLHDVVGALENEAGIDSGVFSALAHLDRAEPPGRLPLADLQRLMHPRYSQPGLSRLVQRMEVAGLVERRAHRGDKRAATVALTRKGRTQFARANAVYTRAVHDEFLAFVAPGNRTQLARELEAIRKRRDDAAQDKE